MPREYKLYLRDMLEAGEKIEAYVQGMDQAQFQQDGQVIDAVLFNLYVIGEAARNIPEDIKNKYPEVAWRQINALRNIIAHVYFGVNLERIWDIVQNDVPRLKVEIPPLLEEE